MQALETEKEYRIILKEKKKERVACDFCKQRKRKCSGTQPCMYCSTHEISCTYTQTQAKRGRPAKIPKLNQPNSGTTVIELPSSQMLVAENGMAVNNNMQEQIELFFAHQGLHMHFSVEEVQNTSTVALRAQLYSVLAYMSRYNGQLDQAKNYITTVEICLKELFDNISVESMGAFLLASQYYPWSNDKGFLYLSHAWNLAKLVKLKTQKAMRMKHIVFFFAQFGDPTLDVEKCLPVLGFTSDRTPEWFAEYNASIVVLKTLCAKMDAMVNPEDPVELTKQILQLTISPQIVEDLLNDYTMAENLYDSNPKIFGPSRPLPVKVYKVLILWKGGYIEKATAAALNLIEFLKQDVFSLIFYTDIEPLVILLGFFIENDYPEEAELISTLMQKLATRTEQPALAAFIASEELTEIVRRMKLTRTIMPTQEIIFTPNNPNSTTNNNINNFINHDTVTSHTNNNNNNTQKQNTALSYSPVDELLPLENELSLHLYP